jgi:release factor glutamine methyltransferase
MSASHRDRPHSFKDALRVAQEILGMSAELVAKGSIEAESELLVLAAYRPEIGRSLTRLELFSRINDRLPDAAGDRLLILAGARAQGKPLQHLTGVQIFLDHEYEVGPDVLVPRPETEVLADHARAYLRALPHPPSLGLEIGLGSGVLSVELLSALPSLKMVSSELTDVASLRAQSNARRILGSERANDLRIVRPKESLEVWEPFERANLGGAAARADFLISNPPYLAPSDPIEAEVAQHEPSAALYAPQSDPLYFYREIALRGQRFLRPGARVFLEIAVERAAETLRVFVENTWKEAVLLPDLTGRDRVLIASSPDRS